MTRIETTRYQASHTKQPKGRGMWMFETRDGRVIGDYNGTYSDAKKFAKEYGAMFNEPVLYVCP